MTRLATVIVPTWNRKEQVDDLLRKLLLEQTGVDFDVVVADDGSNDGTVDHLASGIQSLPATLQDRVRLLSLPHAGVASTRNRAALATSTPWLIFLDSDDRPDESWAATLMGSCTMDHDLVSIAVRRVTPDRRSTVVEPTAAGPAFGGVEALWLAGAFAIRRTLFDEVGGYCDGLAFAENTDLALRVAARNERRRVRTAIDPTPHVNIVVRDGRYDPVVQLESAEAILELHSDRLDLEPKLRSNYEAIAGVAAHRLGDRARARDHLRAAVRSHPSRLKHHARLARAVLP
ncbi:MAG: glycosyltransferase family 2 protein [Acidimicrobiales bacterium]